MSIIPLARRAKRPAPISLSRLLLAGLLALAGLGLFAEPPLAVARAKDQRAKIVADASSYLGIRYVFGGSDASGFDCSGLVFRVYRDVLGLGIPRTAKTLFDFCEAVPRAKLQPGDLVFFDTTDRLAHVGIFVGSGEFIHAASEGPQTGVMRSSLDEAYWTRTYAGGGRLITPAGYLGFILGLAAGPSFGLEDLPRGLTLGATLSWPLGALEPGLQIQPSWDAGLGVVRLPLQLSLALDRQLRFYVGPSLTLGNPRQSTSEGRRDYEPGGGLLASMGLAWSPLGFSAAGRDWRLVATLSYDRYVARSGSVADPDRDSVARVKAGILLETRILL